MSFPNEAGPGGPEALLLRERVWQPVTKPLCKLWPTEIDERLYRIPPVGHIPKGGAVGWPGSRKRSRCHHDTLARPRCSRCNAADRGQESHQPDKADEEVDRGAGLIRVTAVPLRRRAVNLVPERLRVEPVSVTAVSLQGFKGIAQPRRQESRCPRRVVAEFLTRQAAAVQGTTVAATGLYLQLTVAQPLPAPHRSSCALRQAVAL